MRTWMAVLGCAVVVAACDSPSASREATAAGEPLLQTQTGTVARITVSPDPVVITADSAVTLTVMGRDASGQMVGGASYTYASSNTAVFTVSPAGRVEGEGNGTATLTVTSGSASTQVQVTVDPNAASPTPATLTRVNGQGQSGQINTTLPTALTVRVTNQAGARLGGVGVTYTVIQGSATLSNPNPTTNAQGTADTRVTLGNTAGTVRVQADAAGLPPVVFTILAADSNATRPAAVVRMNGQGQSGAPGSTLPNPLTVRVNNANGDPISGVAVAFSVIEGSATLSNPNPATNSSGMAETRVTLGNTAGTVRIQVSVAGVDPVVFTVMSMAPNTTPAAVVRVNGQGQSGTVGTTLPNPLTVRVNNSDGAPVQGVPVTFTVIQGSATLSNPNPTTSAQGLAETRVTLGNTAGTVRIQASVAGVAPQVFTVTATSGAVASVEISPDPIRVRVGQQIQYTVTVRDAFGNVVSGVTPQCQTQNSALIQLNLLGIAVGLLPGQTTVTCTANGVSDTADVIVTLL